MPVSLNCPAGHRLTVSRRYAGTTVRCPQCGEKVRIPSLSTIERKLQEKRQRSSPYSPAKPAHGKQPVARISQREEAERQKQRSGNTAPSADRPLVEQLPSSDASLDTAASVEGEPPLVVPDVAPIEPPPPGPEPPPAGDESLETEALDREKTASTASLDHVAMLRGYEPEAERRWTSYSVGVSLALIGLFGAVPAMMEMVEYAHSDQTIPIAHWAWLAVLAALVQLAYGFYAVQLPDWSTAWVATVVGAALAACYAFLLGLTFVVGSQSRLISLLDLDDQLAEGRAGRWCFAMLGILGLYAYFSGRAALRWRHAFELMRPMRERR
jgi:hypothetical protein